MIMLLKLVIFIKTTKGEVLPAPLYQKKKNQKLLYIAAGVYIILPIKADISPVFVPCPKRLMA